MALRITRDAQACNRALGRHDQEGLELDGVEGPRAVVDTHEAAVCLALDYHNRGKKRWGKGGFWTPGALFNEVFMERLQKNANMTFEDITPAEKPEEEAA